MSYVTTSGGGLAESGHLLEKIGNVVPGWGYAGRKLVASSKDSSPLSNVDKVKVGLAIAAGVAVVLLLISLMASTGILAAKQEKLEKSGMTSQWLGVRHPNEIRLTDNYARPGGNDKHDTFLGHGVGPEFVEQPNYVLENEDLNKSAILKYNRLKAQGAQVSDFKTFLDAYRAENGTDLSSSMYDFGDGFDSKKLRRAGLGV